MPRGFCGLQRRCTASAWLIFNAFLRVIKQAADLSIVLCVHGLLQGFGLSHSRTEVTFKHRHFFVHLLCSFPAPMRGATENVSQRCCQSPQNNAIYRTTICLVFQRFHIVHQKSCANHLDLLRQPPMKALPRGEVLLGGRGEHHSGVVPAAQLLHRAERDPQGDVPQAHPLPLRRWTTCPDWRTARPAGRPTAARHRPRQRQSSASPRRRGRRYCGRDAARRAARRRFRPCAEPSPPARRPRSPCRRQFRCRCPR